MIIAVVMLAAWLALWVAVILLTRFGETHPSSLIALRRARRHLRRHDMTADDVINAGGR